MRIFVIFQLFLFPEDIGNEGIYYCDTEFKVTDEYLDFGTIDGKKTKQLILTVSQEKVVKHQIEVHDLSGNILKYQVTILPLSTLMEPFDIIRINNVTENHITIDNLELIDIQNYQGNPICIYVET